MDKASSSSTRRAHRCRQGSFHPAPEDLDFSPLEELFGERTLQLMLKREKISPERLDMLRSWRHSGFNFDSSRRIEAGDRKSLESLLQYIERPPLALDRLSYREDGMVLYRGGKFHPGLRKDLLIPPASAHSSCPPNTGTGYAVGGVPPLIQPPRPRNRP